MSKTNHVLLILTIIANHCASTDSTNTEKHVFNGFSSSDMKLYGQASIRGHAIWLTQGVPSAEGGAFYGKPLNFSSESSSTSDYGASFSTSFVFAITADHTSDLMKAYQMTFVLSSAMELYNMYNSSGQYVGPPGMANHSFFAIEFSGIGNNHIEIDVKSIVCVDYRITNLYRSNSKFQSTELISGKPMQVWVDYNSRVQILNIIIQEFDQFQMHKPQSQPQFSSSVNLSSFLLDSNIVYAGYSASGTISCNHYVLGWSFMINGEAPLLDSVSLQQILVTLVHDTDISGRKIMHIPMNVLIPTVTLVPIALVLFVVLVACNIKSWMKEYFGHEKCEIECALPSFTYKDLFVATIGFNKMMLLGEGGFGRVYKGVLSVSKQNVAIKRISPESKQGMKEFLTEIAILSQLRHRNLVQLIGYCHHKQDFLLVYDYMPNGSLDMLLYNKEKPTIHWALRLHIIKGVASGLLYLHEDWEQVVIHRDIKASNVLLDDKMNGRLGDFGLARLHGHESDAPPTHVAGTWGYIAPEQTRLGKATKATDVYAFGIFMLEVVCGKRPIEVKSDGEIFLLADWVLHAWQSGSIMHAADTRLKEYVIEELELVLTLGLICSHSLPNRRPCMRLVMQYLLMDTPLPDFLPCFSSTDVNQDRGFNDELQPCPSVATSITGLSGGR